MGWGLLVYTATVYFWKFLRISVEYRPFIGKRPVMVRPSKIFSLFIVARHGLAFYENGFFIGHAVLIPPSLVKLLWREAGKPLRSEFSLAIDWSIVVLSTLGCSWKSSPELPKDLGDCLRAPPSAPVRWYSYRWLTWTLRTQPTLYSRPIVGWRAEFTLAFLVSPTGTQSACFIFPRSGDESKGNWWRRFYPKSLSTCWGWVYLLPRKSLCFL